MPTPHNQANIDEIAKTVIMPGDPLRAKYIAENFLDDYKLVNTVRNMYAYTGKYKGIPITVMASGMGMPSIGIYCYELYSKYNVENIIRIGSCGGWSPDLKLFDIILTTSSYNEGNFALTFNNEDCHLAESSQELNNKIASTAHKLNFDITTGTVLCSDCFDLYILDNAKALENRIPANLNIIAAEMESFALFYTAHVLGKKAACLLSVVDLKYDSTTKATTIERETGLNNMITLALESCL